MLKPEQIEQRLKAARQVKPWVRARIERLRTLHGELRTVGHLLLGCNEAGDPVREDWRPHSAGVSRMAKLKEPELLQLGEALLPDHVDVLHAAWQLHARLPIQGGYARKPFRAPDRADLLLPRRRAFLANLVESLHGYSQDLPWIAAHAPHLSNWDGGSAVGILLAGAIDLGGPRAAEIEQILRDSAAGVHEVGMFGRHVTTAFLCCSRAECWEFIEKMLLAAQRQEGLRQVILESVDFAHPDAFRRMLRTIEANNLVRFSATVRAADVWLALQLDSCSTKYAQSTLSTIAQMLDDKASRRSALAGDDAEQAYFALWSIAFDDAPAAIAPAAELLKHRAPEVRFIALHFLASVALRETYDHFRQSVDDPDLRVACYAAALAAAVLNGRMSSSHGEDGDWEAPAPVYMQASYYVARDKTPPQDSGDLFDRLGKLLPRVPDKARGMKPLVWPWLQVTVARRPVADAMVLALGARPASALLPFLDGMSPGVRGWVANLLARQPALDALSRQALLKLVGDASGVVREAAVKAMRKLSISPADAASLEPLLTRKASDMRRGVLSLILSLKDAPALQSATRLLGAGNASQRLAGLDLLSQMHEKGRSVAGISAAAEAYRAQHATLTRDEQVYLDKLRQHEQVQVTLDDALGLMDPARRTPPTPPRKRDVRPATSAAAAILKSLDELVHEHRETPIALKRYSGDTDLQPLGSIQYGFPDPYEQADNTERSKTVMRPITDLPLHEVWLGWWNDRPADLRDADGLEAARALALMTLADDRGQGWKHDLFRAFFGVDAVKPRYAVVPGILEWLLAHNVPPGLADFALDASETLLAGVPQGKLNAKQEYGDYELRTLLRDARLLGYTERVARHAQQWTGQHTLRMFGLLRWLDEPGVRMERARPDWNIMVEAFEIAAANEHDMLDCLLGPRHAGRRYSTPEGFGSLARASASLRRGALAPASAAIVQRAIDRILEVELTRGESETPASRPASALKYAGGTGVLVRVLQAVGRDPKLQRGYSYIWSDDSQGKSTVFSHLIRATFPGKAETPEQFVQAVTAAGIQPPELLAVAFYAPQWARFIQAAVGWPMLEEAVWWIHAHTRDRGWQVDPETRELWHAEIRKLTPLTLEDLMDGAVDVDWFQRTYSVLGKPRWEALDKYAKYASAGTGHARARLFADAMLKRVTRKDLISVIEKKRKQDAVRALGLLPLDRKNPKKDLLARYRVTQEFIRTSRQFGSLRQASEKLAARIAQENLARTAGYPDPVRLQWAMEGLATADLAGGPVVVKVKDVAVSLAVDPDGLPEITAARGDKTLKNIPPDVRKHERVRELAERKTDLRRSASRMRQSLELAMCRGDRFSAEELRELMGNVILRPILDRLVFIGEGIVGYPVDAGRALRDERGTVEPVKPGEILRLAHPSDLLHSGRWSQWQRECFAAERVQPFKQVFRELYVQTAQEKSDNTFSRRYAGQQVNPRQAMAILGSRGWVTAPEAGVFRTFHDEKLVAWIEFMEAFFTPADIEGLTLEKVRFARRGEYEHVSLSEIPPRLFSEVMRDVDLIVSVAHRGAVDPEASASTVELRSALLRETLQLLKLDNVAVKAPHVHIRGTLAEYSVHMGSATTHMLPGGALFIVPVHSQHRGRIFLPFADDDPKTAELISKVLLLARDQEIRDLNLLEQIRSRG